MKLPIYKNAIKLHFYRKFLNLWFKGGKNYEM